MFFRLILSAPGLILCLALALLGRPPCAHAANTVDVTGSGSCAQRSAVDQALQEGSPPGGRSRTATSISGRVISASSAALDQSGVIGPSTRFIAMIATAGYADLTMQAAGCAVKTRSVSMSDGTAASISGDSGGTSA
jgi:hypothetical protein